MESWTVGKFENFGVPPLYSRYNLPPLVEIVLTNLPKSGSATPGDNRPGKYKRKKTKCHNIEMLSIEMRPQAMNESYMFHN